MDHPDVTLSNFMETSFGLQRVNTASMQAPDEGAYWKTIFFISHPKHMLWVLKRTVSLRRFF